MEGMLLNDVYAARRKCLASCVPVPPATVERTTIQAISGILVICSGEVYSGMPNA